SSVSLPPILRPNSSSTVLSAAQSVLWFSKAGLALAPRQPHHTSGRTLERCPVSMCWPVPTEACSEGCVPPVSQKAPQQPPSLMKYGQWRTSTYPAPLEVSTCLVPRQALSPVTWATTPPAPSPSLPSANCPLSTLSDRPPTVHRSSLPESVGDGIGESSRQSFDSCRSRLSSPRRNYQSF
ncbi:hypothetical protein KUCAC02_030436, partial [Chaenocephalus aceratus]